MMTRVVGSPNQTINSLDEDGLQELYAWIDEISLSREKRNIWRDFSDGGKFLNLLVPIPLLDPVSIKSSEIDLQTVTLTQSL